MSKDTARRIVELHDAIEACADPSSHRAAELRGELSRLCIEEVRRMVVDKARKTLDLPALFE